MQAELEGYLDQLTSTRQDAPGIVAGLTEAQFNWRPARGKWSIGECFDHLNLTARQFVPAFDGAIAHARQAGLTSSGPFAYPLLERWFVRSMEPPVRQRMRARKGFKPAPQQSAVEVMTRFEAVARRGGRTNPSRRRRRSAAGAVPIAGRADCFLQPGNRVRGIPGS
jgi:hypothetical protein